jgi:hypothetical protein
MLFDTTKLQRLVPGFAPAVPFAEGARRVVRHHDEHAGARSVNAELAAAFDRLAAR